MRYRRNTEETNFWAGYADCMLALFMIALVLWILSAGITAFTDSKLAGVVDENERLKKENAKLREDIEKDSDWYVEYQKKLKELKRLNERIAMMKALPPKVKALESKLSLASDWYKRYAELNNMNVVQVQARQKLEEEVAAVDVNSVENAKVIDSFIGRVNKLKDDNTRLVEANNGLIDDNADLKRWNNALLKKNEKVLVEIAGTGETFESGNAVINSDFREKLEGPEGPFANMASQLKKRDGNNVILEIIGHTDGEPVSKSKRKLGNLDDKLPDYLTKNNFDVRALIPGSNNDIGLLRALAIKKAWSSYVKKQPNNAKMRLVDIYCYSAGQTQPVNGNLKLPDTYSIKNAASRRIEMRLRNLD